MRPVCVRCGREMNCEKNDVLIWHPYEAPRPTDPPKVETSGGWTMVNTDRMLDPRVYEEPNRIDFIAQGDKYRCPDCGYEIVTGIGMPTVDFKAPQEYLQKQVAEARKEGTAIRVIRK